MAELVEAEELGEGGMSKNALKKQQKAEEAAKKKAEKDAEKAAKAALEPKKEKVGVAEEVEELDPTKYYENRLSAINQMEVNELYSLSRTVFKCFTDFIFRLSLS